MNNQQTGADEEGRDSRHTADLQQRAGRGDDPANRTQDAFKQASKTPLRALLTRKDSFDAQTQLAGKLPKEIPVPDQSEAPAQPDGSVRQSRRPSQRPSAAALKPSEIAQSKLQQSLQQSSLQQSAAAPSRVVQSVTSTEEQRAAAPLHRNYTVIYKGKPTEVPPLKKGLTNFVDIRSYSKQSERSEAEPSEKLATSLITDSELASKHSGKPASAMLIQENEQPSQIHMGTVGNQGDAESQQVRPNLAQSKKEYEESQHRLSQYSKLIKEADSSPRKQDGFDQRTQLYQDYGSTLAVPGAQADAPRSAAKRRPRNSRERQQPPNESQVLAQWKNEFQRVEQKEKISRQPSNRPQMRDGGNSAQTKLLSPQPSVRDQANQMWRKVGQWEVGLSPRHDGGSHISIKRPVDAKDQGLSPQHSRKPTQVDGANSVQTKQTSKRKVNTQDRGVQPSQAAELEDEGQNVPRLIAEQPTQLDLQDGATSIQSKWLNPIKHQASRVQQAVKSLHLSTHNSFRDGATSAQSKWLNPRRDSQITQVELYQDQTPKPSLKFKQSSKQTRKEEGIEYMNAKSLNSSTDGAGMPAPKLNNYSMDNDKMIGDVLGTELVIEKCIKVMEREQGEEKGWAVDTVLNKDLVKGLSHSKMKNEMDQRAPRVVDEAGVTVPISLCASTGWHSGSRRWRESEIQKELGSGISLYFKLLKYIGCLFFLFTLLSAFPMAIYFSGGAYEFEKIESQKWLSITNLGNLGEYQHKICTSVELPPVANEVAYVGFSCKKGRTLKGLLNFGLAYQGNSCSGKGDDISVVTTRACSIGTMPDLRNEWEIESSFTKDCVGRNTCSFRIDYKAAFDSECNKELKQRQSNKSNSGPARVYALAMCEQEYIDVLPQLLTLKLSREQATMAIVGLDVAIVLIFFIAILRLRFYEDLTIQDMKQAEHRIEDFSVHLQSIPISEDKYMADADLLSAIMAPHLEDEVAYGIEKAGTPRDQALSLAQIVKINYGRRDHNTMRHLVGILDNIRHIQALRQKMQNDPKNTQNYEEQMWQHYTQVTIKKEMYIQARHNSKEGVCNAYITFKSLEGKEKVMSAYDVNRVQRFAAERLCGLGSMFSNKKLLHSGFPIIIDTVEPENIAWENLGGQKMAKMKKWMGITLISVVFFVVSFLGIWSIQLFERGRDVWIKSDCLGPTTFSHSEAQEDFNLPIPDQKGILNCYCSDMYDLYSFDALKILFQERRKLCQEWYPYALAQNYLNYIMVAFISGMNLLLQISLDWIGQFNRTKNQSDSYIYRMVAIFIAQYINTAIVIIIVYHRFLASADVDIHEDVDHFLTGPFDEFDVRWYLVVGVPIVMSIGVQILFPHIGLLWSWSTSGFKRCCDRKCTFNPRRTRQIIQSDYEDLYTGPQFVLHIRYAQILSTIFVTMTYSSGLPMLYFISFISFFITYWTDKCLVLRYFRKTEGLNKDLSKTVINWLPLSLVLHGMFGITIFSYPNILKSEALSSYIGNDSQYYNSQRIGQHHIVLFTAATLLVIVLWIVERPFVAQLSRCWSRCTARCRRESSESYRAKCDDIYSIMSFKQLTTLLAQIQAQRSRLSALKAEDQVSSDSNKSHVARIDRYLQLLKRNKEQVHNRIMELTDLHSQHIENYERLPDQEAQIAAVLSHYEQAIDINNPNRLDFKLEPEMNGSIVNKVPSYDLSAHPKYQNVEKLRQIMDETFGLPKQAWTQDVENHILQTDGNNQTQHHLELMDIDSSADATIDGKPQKYSAKRLKNSYERPLKREKRQKQR